MQTSTFLQDFRDWLLANQPALDEANIEVTVLGQTQDHVPNSIHVELRSEQYEVTVQLWEDGLSDFHFLDWKAAANPDYQVEVTHHEFQSESELFTALGDLVKRMTEDDIPTLVIKNWPFSGSSKTVYHDPFSGKRPSAPAVKGKP